MRFSRLSTRNHHRFLAIPVLAALACGLISCSTVTEVIEGPTPKTPERKQPPVPKVAPKLIPDGSASDNLPYFREVLRTFGEGTEAVQGRPIVDALTASGFDKSAMQVSFDQSKTGLGADSIYVSVRIGSDCLLGQLIPEDRSSTAQVQPAVGQAKEVCLIGNTRQITW